MFAYFMWRKYCMGRRKFDMKKLPAKCNNKETFAVAVNLEFKT